MGFSYIEGMAALGEVDYQAVGLEGFGKPDNYLERQPARWLSQLRSYSKFDTWTGFRKLPKVDTIVSWLENYMPETFSPGIIHGDCHLANTMFSLDNAELVAFVDWELSTIGDPLIDLGWVIATWPDPDDGKGTIQIDPWDGFPTVNDLIAHYGERSQRNLDSISWYGVLACFKLGSILEGTHARASAGKAPKDIGDQLHQLTIGLFERAHRLIAEA